MAVNSFLDKVETFQRIMVDYVFPKYFQPKKNGTFKHPAVASISETFKKLVAHQEQGSINDSK